MHKWKLLRDDFSVPGGELGKFKSDMQMTDCHARKVVDSTPSKPLYTGPTLKLKRFFVVKKYSEIIDSLYN